MKSIFNWFRILMKHLKGIGLVANLFIKSQESLSNGMLFIGVALVAWYLGSLMALNFHTISMPKLPSLSLQKPVQSFAGTPSYLMGETSSDGGLNTTGAMEVMPLTRLNLKLIGLVDLGTQGVALIQSSQKTYVVSQGEEFLNDLTLEEVGGRYVVLNNRGQLEKLLLVDNATDMVSLAEKKSAVGALSITQRKQLKKISSQLKQSPLILGQLISFKVIEQNGSWLGIKIWPKTDKTLFKSLGLKEGDLVTHINGNSIREIAQNQSLWKKLTALNEFELVIERNNETQTIQVNLN